MFNTIAMLILEFITTILLADFFPTLSIGRKTLSGQRIHR